MITRAILRSMSDKDGFICKPGHKKPKIRITDDGTIYRADTDLTICKAMTLVDAAKALGIKN